MHGRAVVAALHQSKTPPNDHKRRDVRWAWGLTIFGLAQVVFCTAWVFVDLATGFWPFAIFMGVLAPANLYYVRKNVRVLLRYRARGY